MYLSASKFERCKYEVPLQRWCAAGTTIRLGVAEGYLWLCFGRYAYLTMCTPRKPPKAAHKLPAFHKASDTLPLLDRRRTGGPTMPLKSLSKS